MKNIFITLEGPDGSGKTTQIELLKKYLESRHYEILVAREPGGTKISEKIREIILDKDNEEMSYMTELMLYTAARAQLVDEVIRPALKDGKIVICDRFYDSAAVYQGIARGLGTDVVYQVNEYALNGLKPDVTFFMDMNAEEGIRRKKNQAELDRMEMEKAEFHQKVVDGYRRIAKEKKDRIITVNAMDSIEQIQKKLQEEVMKRL